MRKPNSRFAKPLGSFVGDVVAPSLAARGLGEASLVTHWAEIVGADVARFARPLQLQWPPRGPKRDPDSPAAAATLVLRIDGAFALEASHAGASIVARVNAHLGWRCVEKLAFRQGPLAALRRPRARPAPPSPRALAAARALGAGIVDEELRDALTRLGARIIDKAAPKG
jgi:hypothetical protein